METWMNCCWAHWQHPYLLHDLVEHQASVGNLCKHFFVFHSWSICLDERSDFLWFTCIWCKLPPWIRESMFLPPLEPSQVSYARAKYSVVRRLATSIPYVYPSTPSHWLSCSKIKESVQGELFGLPRVETSMSLMMVPPPELGSVLL